MTIDNLTGKGVGVAILDTGIYPHPDFDSRICAFQDFINHKKIAYDDNSHGTHVAGVIAGSGLLSKGIYQGIAPGAHLIICKVLDDEGNGKVSSILSGLRWIRNNRERLGIRIVNISVGALSKNKMEEDSVLVRGVDAAWEDDLVVVVAAGNEGPKAGSITTPGISRSVITVGCSDDNFAVEVGGSRIVDYSGRGPTKACIVKPDVVTMGSNIISCNAMVRRTSRPYTKKSGTSMATPIVSGAIALLLERYPDMNNRDVKLKIKYSTDDLGMPMNRQGWGKLNMKKLLK